MTLLYAALAYLLGLALARWWWEAAGIACPPGGELWLAALACLPLMPLLNRGRQRRSRGRSHPPLRWSEEAGFVPPGQPCSPAVPAGVAICLLAGFLRYGSQPFTPCWKADDLAYYNLPAEAAFDRGARQVTVTGVVDAYPLVVDGKQELYVAAQTIVHGVPRAEAAVRGTVRVTTSGTGRLRYGQHVAVSGRMVEPAVFEDFSYKDYLAVKGVRSVMYGAAVKVLDAEEYGSPLLRRLYGLRARGEAFVNHSLPEPYAALANGMLLGIEANIPKELYDQFKATGTSHVIVISGTNVALIAGVLVAVAARLVGRRRAAWPALGGIAGYALLVGGDATVVRAAVMGGLFVTATALGRRSTALVSLAAACMAMTLINPLALWDVGLQLSAMATAGLVVLGTGHGVLAVTLAASVATLPLGLYYFGRLSPASLPANLLIAPVQPLILFGGSAALLLGLGGQEVLGGVLLWLPWLGLAWTVGVVRWAAALPFATVYVDGFGVAQVVAAYAAIGLAQWRQEVGEGMRRVIRGGGKPSTAGEDACAPGVGGTRAGGGMQAKMQANPTQASGTPTLPARDLVPLRSMARLLVAPGGLMVACAVAVLVWGAALAQPDGRLHVWFLDVGQGDGILIQTPAGRQVLVDGGASGQVLLGQLGAVMPFWDRTLDLVVLTHPDADHMAAQVEAAGRYGIAAAWETPASAADAAGAPWRSAVERAGAQVQVQSGGGWVDLGDGVALWVLSPPAQGFAGEDADNQNSLVAKLVYGGFSVLLTGDAGTAAEHALVAQGAPVGATVLKVAHHGSKSATGAAFVAAVRAPIAVIQVGVGNDYGHPHAETLARLAGRLILRNDEDGRIHLWSDGRQVWVEEEKG